MMKLLALAALLAPLSLAMPDIGRMQREAAAEDGEIWALLAAGSNGWWNYRHQSDICHAYHILSAHGIPDDHIVVMMYDDIAENSQNPTKGTIINKPYGKNLYPGTPKDYVGRDVTPANFLKILQGEDMAGTGTGKTLHSTRNDRVFVFFAGLGGNGIVAFAADILHADDLNSALKAMHTAGKYSQLVFYMEASASGSMFNTLLPKDISVYAMTAANPSESSWGCYCSNPEHLPCLGDLFGVMWMQNSEKEDLQKETLQQQYEIVKKETTKSHVMQYGDLSMTGEPVADFQGMKEPPKDVDAVTEVVDKSAVESREVYMHHMNQRYEQSTDEAEKEQLLKDINWMKQKRAYVDKVVSWIVDRVVPPAAGSATAPAVVMSRPPAALTRVQCHKQAVAAFGDKCFDLSLNPYALRYSSALANLCEMGAEAGRVLAAVDAVCGSLKDKPQGVH